MAEAAEKELEENVTNLPSYIKDTTDFLRKIEIIKHELPNNAILLAMDVKSLYPSIPQTQGLQACQNVLEKRTSHSIDTQAAMEMLHESQH